MNQIQAELVAYIEDWISAANSIYLFQLDGLLKPNHSC